MVPCVFNWEDMHDAPTSLLFTEHKRLRSSCQQRSCVNTKPSTTLQTIIYLIVCHRSANGVYNSMRTIKHNYNSMLISLSLSQTLECTGFSSWQQILNCLCSTFDLFLFLASHAHYTQISYWVERESGTWSELCAEQINLALRILGSVMMQNGLGNMSTVQTIDVSTARVWVSWHPMKRQPLVFFFWESITGFDMLFSTLRI